MAEITTATGPKPRLLFIDDDMGVLELMCDHAQSWGYDARSLADSRQALEQAALLKPDLIVLDVQMPHRSGFEVFAELRSDDRTASLPIIFLTASGTEMMARVKGLE